MCGSGFAAGFNDVLAGFAAGLSGVLVALVFAAQGRAVRARQSSTPMFRQCFGMLTRPGLCTGISETGRLETTIPVDDAFLKKLDVERIIALTPTGWSAENSILPVTLASNTYLRCRRYGAYRRAKPGIPLDTGQQAPVATISVLCRESWWENASGANIGRQIAECRPIQPRISMPPSTVSVMPVTKLARSLSR